MSEAKSSKISTGKTVLTKKDINNMILERKYNGKLFTKEELLKKVKERLKNEDNNNRITIR